MRRLAQILMIFIVACSSSSHLAVMQAVAWTGMFVENVQVHRLDEAVSRTFDGAHPCGLCEVIQEAQGDRGDRDHAPSLNVQVLDLKLVALEALRIVPPAPERLPVGWIDSRSADRGDRPPVPPPDWV